MPGLTPPQPDNLSLPLKNRILSGLPSEEYERLLPYLEPVTLKIRDVLVHPNTPIQTVYFPLDAVMSLLNFDEEGKSLEVGMVGKEGMSGHWTLLGENRVPQQCIVQIAGEAMRMDAATFLEEAERNPTLRSQTLRFTQALFNQVTQSSACNHFHEVGQRLCRWLLMSQDRKGENRFYLTQEFIGIMLGVRRPTVTLIARVLQEAGMIQYSRGVMTILDRKGLEESVCECYGIIKTSEDRLLPILQAPTGPEE
jgi:CRP-like cAMP-binding protein